VRTQTEDEYETYRSNEPSQCGVYFDFRDKISMVIDILTGLSYFAGDSILDNILRALAIEKRYTGADD
jgi:hypothetical protein